MKNVQIYADRIAETITPFAGQPDVQQEKLSTILAEQGLDTSGPILYGYDFVRGIFWFRNDPRGEMLKLPLHKVRVWPEQTPELTEHH